MTPQELKSSILQLAVQGRLVEQRPEEGTAEELYRQIQEEKQRLIKDSKIKKEKPLPEIAEDEVPFDIPESWKWVRFSNLFDIGSAIRIHQSDWKTEGIPFLRGRELVRLAKTGNPEAEIFISQELYETNKTKGGIPVKNDLLVTAVGTLGKVYIVKGTHPFYYKDAYILRYNNYGNLFSPFFKLVIESPAIQDYIAQGSMGTTVAQLTIQKAKKMLCPLPPLAEQKRIVAKIEDLLPLIDRYEKAWSKLEDFNKRFPHDMQKSVLQMAIQGKLVEQRPEEGTGEELYRQIQAEKQRLIKEGKIKKEKTFPEISEDEIPFDIPESWKWVRLATITDMLSGFAFKSNDYKLEGKYRLLRGINLGVDEIRWDETVFVDAVSVKHDSYKLESGDVLLGLDRPWISNGTRVAIFDDIVETYLVQRVLRIRGLDGIISPYISLLLHSSLLKNPLDGETTGISVPHISQSQVGNIIVPLPPLAEQKRIVQKLEEILPLCERLK